MNDILSEKDTRAVQDILVEQLGVSLDQLTWEARLAEDLGADSLTKMEISMALEDYFHLSLPDDQVEKIWTVGDVFEALAPFLNRIPR